MVVIRVQICGNEISNVYLKYIAAEHRFSRRYILADLAEPQMILTPDERCLIKALARKMGLDFGEMDVLRDTDGRIYVVDVNSAPGGLPDPMSRINEKKMLRRAMPAFEQLLRTHSGRSAVA